MNWKPYAKAIAGAAVAGLTSAGTALTDGAIDPTEWITIAVATLTALGVIWSVPNAPDSGSDPAGQSEYIGRHRSGTE